MWYMFSNSKRSLAEARGRFLFCKSKNLKRCDIKVMSTLNVASLKYSIINKIRPHVSYVFVGASVGAFWVQNA